MVTWPEAQRGFRVSLAVAWRDYASLCSSTSTRTTPHSFTPTMANVLQPQPNPFGFAFGLSSPSSNIMGWSQPPMTHPLHHLAAPATQPSRLKRRFEPEDENDTGPQRPSPGARDESMDRSPTPERPKRGVPKRARTSPATNILGSKDVKENKSTESDNDVDVGVLLGEPDSCVLALRPHE